MKIKNPFIVLVGSAILLVFTFVIVINLLPNSERNAYYENIDSNAKVELIFIEDGQMHITTTGNAKEYCVKSTKSTPQLNSLCWKKLINNEGLISIYKDKEYYVWIKDTDNKISNPEIVNAHYN